MRKKVNFAKILLLVTGILMVASGGFQIYTLVMSIINGIDLQNMRNIISIFVSIINIAFLIGGGVAGVVTFKYLNYQNIGRTMQYGIVILAVSIINAAKVVYFSFSGVVDILGLVISIISVFLPSLYTLGAYILKSEWEK